MTTTDAGFIDNLYSDWECELLGCGRAILLRPVVDKVPNAFWRFMQWVLLGNKWRKVGK